MPGYLHPILDAIYPPWDEHNTSVFTGHCLHIFLSFIQDFCALVYLFILRSHKHLAARTMAINIVRLSARMAFCTITQEQPKTESSNSAPICVMRTAGI